MIVSPLTVFMCKKSVRLVTFFIFFAWCSFAFGQRIRSLDDTERQASMRPTKFNKFKYFYKNKEKYVDYYKLIDTNSVYVSRNESSPTFIRFFSNGRFYHSFEYNPPIMKEEFNKLDYGKWGMFKVNRNGIVLEWKNYNSFPQNFMYYYGEIFRDELIFIKLKFGRFILNAERHINDVYYKEKLD